ncbi:MAG: protein-tyrosine-phosphatase [Saprospiraceae bacterium]|nr:protein-tyrosine-phosphatase [Saprospiraceae bacterium]
MYPALRHTISLLSTEQISPTRRDVLQPLIEYIRTQRAAGNPVLLNFICTHNSRRSHLSQIWAQAMAYHFGIREVYCYSGGTEATAMFPKVGETLIEQGFIILPLSAGENPVYAVKFDENTAPVICFSKTYDHPFNPKNGFGAVMTCDSADENCPIVSGAQKRFPIKYEDPKRFDNTPLQDAKYAERSLEIAREMLFVFSSI